MSDLSAGAWVWPGSDDVADRAGQCYTLAMEAVLGNARFGARLFLVHGLLHPDRSSMRDTLYGETGTPPPSNPHAWVEIEADDGVMALDPVLRMMDERGAFYALFGCEPVRRYRGDVAVSIAARRDSYGPWDRATLAQWEQRQREAAINPEWSTERALARYFGTTQETAWAEGNRSGKRSASTRSGGSATSPTSTTSLPG